jgi:hypothetical protein
VVGLVEVNGVEAQHTQGGKTFRRLSGARGVGGGEGSVVTVDRRRGECAV